MNHICAAIRPVFRSQNVFFSTSKILRETTKAKPVERPRNYRQKKSTDEKIGLGGWLLLSIPLTTFGLGTWQVQRKAWKEDLIKKMALKAQMEAVPLPDDLDDVNKMEFQRVKVQGHFLHNKELVLGPRSLLTDHLGQGGGVFTQQQDDNVGFHIITPFQLADREEIILINRGWVHRTCREPHTRPEGQIEGDIEIIGLVRCHEPRPVFTPENRGRLFVYRDLEKMSRLTGSEPILLDAVAETTVPGGPIGGQTRITLRNEHLSYIVTWYGLSAATAWMWYTRIYKRAMLK